MLMVPTDSEDGIQYRGMLMDWEMSESVEPGVDRITSLRVSPYSSISHHNTDDPSGHLCVYFREGTGLPKGVPRRR